MNFNILLFVYFDTGLSFLFLLPTIIYKIVFVYNRKLKDIDAII